MEKSPEQIVQNFHESTSELKKTIDGIPDEIFDEKPGDDGWSIAQILEHLYRSEYGLLKLFKGSSKHVTDRTPGKKIPLFEQTFVKSDKKYNAPEQVAPQGEWEREELCEKFFNNRKLLHQILSEGKVNLKELRLAYEHPFFGPLTGVEWVVFVNMHTARHHQQIRDVLGNLN